MAIDWSAGTNALFKKLGRIARIVEIYDAFETDIDGDLSGLVTTTWTEDVDYYTAACTAILQLKDQIKNQLSAMREEIASTAPYVVQGELTAQDGAPALSQPDLMTRLVQRMFEANYGVAPAGPDGDGDLTGTGYLCKWFGTQSLYSSNASYSARDRGFSHIQGTTLTTETTDAANRYREKVALATQEYGYRRPGGQNWGKSFGRTIFEVTNASTPKNKVKNGSFENTEIDNKTAKDWVLDGGAWDTDVEVFAYGYISNRSLEITNKDTVVKQSIPEGTLKPRTVYVASFRGHDPDGAGDWEVKLDLKTPYQTLNVITLGLTAGAPDWSTAYGVFITPDVTTGMEWLISIAETSPSGPAYVDEIIVVEASTFAGVPFILVPYLNGTAIVGEKKSTSVTVYTGKFASFFGRFFNTHLPNHSGGTAINDSLVA